MARTKRSSKLDSKKRLALEAGKRHLDQIGLGQYLIYQRPVNGSAGSWLARAYDKETGKQIQKRLGTADDFSDADAETILTFPQAQEKAKLWFKALGEAKKAAESGVTISDSPYTVADAIKDYIEDGHRRGMKSVLKTEQSANANILPSLGDIEVAKLTRTKIESWQKALADSPRKVRTKKQPILGEHIPTPRIFKNPRPQKPTKNETKIPETADQVRARKDTSNRILTILKAALNLALDRKRVSGSGEAWKTVKPFRGVSSARIRFLTIEDQKRLVAACESDFRRLVQAALFTGARYGELTRLVVEDFNSQAKTLFIAESKSGKPRHIVLTDEASEWFMELIAGRSAKELLFMRDEVKRRSRKALMLNSNAWTHADQQRPMLEACTRAKMDPIRFHELRHSYASMLVNAGCPLVYVAAQLGHSDTRMVEKHYGHLAPNALAEAIRTLAPQLGIASPSKIHPIKLA